MADLLALLQSKAEEIDNETKKKEIELQQKELREAELEKALSEMRSGLIEKKRAFDSKKRLLEDKKRQRDQEKMKAQAAIEATGIRIDITGSSDEGDSSCHEGDFTPEPSPRDLSSEEITDDDAPEEATALPGDMEKELSKEERMKKRRSTIKANDIEYEKGEGGTITVGAATLPGLFDLLVSTKPPVQGLDLDHFMEVFVQTHTTFTQSTYMFDVLSKVFMNEYKPLEKIEPCPNRRARVLEVMLKWLERCAKEFQQESILRLLVDTWLAKIKATISNITEEEGEEKRKQEKVLALYEKLCQALINLDESIKATKEAKEREEEERKRKEEARRSEERLMNIDSSKEEHKDVLLKYSAAMLAQQLTLVDFKLYSSIEFNEFFHCGWTRENKNELSPNLVKFIDRFNALSAWIQTQLVSCETVEARVELLARLIQIGKEFEALNNFQGMMLINAALNSSPILRMKNTWAALPESSHIAFNSLMMTLSHNKNYMVYRNKLITCEQPLVPFIAIHLSDLTFIDENEDKISRHKLLGRTASGKLIEAQLSIPSEKNFSDNSEPDENNEDEMLINFTKMELLSKVLNQLRQFQKVGYDRYQPSLYLQKYFGGVEADEKEKFSVLPEKQIYESSLRVEPRSANNTPQGARKRGFSIGRTNKSKPPALARSNSQKGLTEKEDKDVIKKKKKEKVKNNKYNTMNPKKSAKRDSVSDLSVHINPLLANSKVRRHSEADLAGSPPPSVSHVESKTVNPLLGLSASFDKLPSFDPSNLYGRQPSPRPERKGSN